MLADTLTVVALLSSILVLVYGLAVLAICPAMELSKRAVVGWGLVLISGLTLEEIFSSGVSVTSAGITLILATVSTIVLILPAARRDEVLTDVGVLDAPRSRARHAHR